MHWTWSYLSEYYPLVEHAILTRGAAPTANGSPSPDHEKPESYSTKYVLLYQNTVRIYVYCPTLIWYWSNCPSHSPPTAYNLLHHQLFVVFLSVCNAVERIEPARLSACIYHCWLPHTISLWSVKCNVVPDLVCWKSGCGPDLVHVKCLLQFEDNIV